MSAIFPSVSETIFAGDQEPVARDSLGYRSLGIRRGDLTFFWMFSFNVAWHLPAVTKVLDGSDATSSIICGFFSRWTLFLVSLGYIAWTLTHVRHPKISLLDGVAAGKEVDFFKRVFFEGVSTNGALPFVREIGGEDGGAFLPTRPSECTFVKAF